MNYENPSFPVQKETETYICNDATNNFLAWDIAHAEKPYRDAAVELKKLPGTEAAVAVLGRTATEKGNEIGRAYVVEKQAELDRLKGQFSESAEQTTVRSVETESSLEQWADNAKKALAEKYNASPEDFELVSYESETGETINAVVYTAANGIDLGDPKKDRDEARSWNKVMDDSAKNKARHMVTIDGVGYDDRKMTYALYDQLVEAAKKAERPLPDSKDTKITSNSGDKWYSWTIMSGEPLTAGGDAPIARVNDDGSVFRGRTYVGCGSLDLRVRPAVIRSTADLR